MDEILRVEELSKSVAARDVLKNLNFSVPFGQTVGLIGSNGAGKTTLLSIIAGRSDGTAGRIYFRGRPILRSGPSLRRSLAFLPADEKLPEDVAVSDYLTFRAGVRGLTNPNASIDEVLQCCDLHRKARHRTIGCLSRGARRRVALADTLLGRPELLLLDDPTDGLDLRQLDGLARILENLQTNTTILFASHHLDLIERSCCRLLVLHRGRIVADGSQSELAAHFGRPARWNIKIRWCGGEDRPIYLLAPGIRILSEEWEGDYGLLGVQLPDGGEAAIIRELSQNLAFDLLEIRREVPSLASILLAATDHDWENPLP